MAAVTWKGRVMPLDPGETVLDGLLRQGVEVAFSCRAGACQSCLMRAALGTALPDVAQKGLGSTLRERRYFLACQLIPAEDIQIADDATLPEVGVVVRRLERPTADVLRLWLAPDEPFEYRAGQFVNLARADGLTRSYSLASVPGRDPWLELHVRRMPGGQMSNYLHDDINEGDRLGLRGPSGDCFYVAGRSRAPLLLVGTGTGLAPLLGIVRDALDRRHEGPIWLMHGAPTAAGLYAHEGLSALRDRHPTLSYEPCVLSAPVHAGVAVGSLADRVMARVRTTPGLRVFLCGPPDLVRTLRRQVYLAGVPLEDILADAFVTATPPPFSTSVTT